MNTYLVKFKYCDQYSRGRWSENSSTFEANSELEAIRKCKEFFGLGIDPDCEYEILSVKKV